MSKAELGGYIHGNTALKGIDRQGYAHIITPEFNSSSRKSPRVERAHRSVYENSNKSRIMQLLESSEMACSLMYEDFRGVEFGTIPRKQSIIAGISLSVFFIISIFLGV